MKKMIAYAAPMAMALSFAAAPTAVHADPGNVPAGQLCNEAVLVSTGTCVNFVNKGIDDPVALCKVLKDLGILEQIGIRNLGQCIKVFS